MAFISDKKRTKYLVRNDIEFLLRTIFNSPLTHSFPISDREKTILKLLWDEGKSFSEVATQLGLSRERVSQLYNSEVRRLSYFITSTFKEVDSLKKELELLKSKTALTQPDEIYSYSDNAQKATIYFV